MSFCWMGEGLCGAGELVAEILQAALGAFPVGSGDDDVCPMAAGAFYGLSGGEIGAHGERAAAGGGSAFVFVPACQLTTWLPQSQVNA